MKRSHILAAVLAAFACSTMEAETGITAKIPFDFQIGSTAMPAGDYRIDYSNRLLMVRSKIGNHTAMALTLPESRSKAPETWVLRFRCYGDSHFLAGIWGPESPEGGALPKGRREKEVASRVQPTQPTAVALAGR
jgi:hypothetical protein